MGFQFSSSADDPRRTHFAEVAKTYSTTQRPRSTQALELMTATISTIYRYPVKSMGGDTLQQTNLTTNGIPGDRCWTLKDEERGGIKGGKRFPHLMSMHATLEQEPDEQHPLPSGHHSTPR